MNVVSECKCSSWTVRHSIYEMLELTMQTTHTLSDYKPIPNSAQDRSIHHLPSSASSPLLVASKSWKSRLPTTKRTMSNPIPNQPKSSPLAKVSPRVQRASSRPSMVSGSKSLKTPRQQKTRISALSAKGCRRWAWRMVRPLRDGSFYVFTWYQCRC
jgi:hypothetical protein